MSSRDPTCDKGPADNPGSSRRACNGLGELNDIAADEERLAAIGRGSNTNRAFAAGLLSGREDTPAEAAMAVASEAHAELAKVKPFWR